jgi:hypothetical protein
MEEKIKWGGSRKNAGAKLKYNEPTTTIAFRCPISKVTELKSLVNDKLQQFVNLK